MPGDQNPKRASKFYIGVILFSVLVSDGLHRREHTEGLETSEISPPAEPVGIENAGLRRGH